ncbi:putative pectinesterase inhibitor domain-containing protein [Helianthus anomalus]
MPSLSFSKIFFALSVVSVMVISNAELVDDVCRKLGHEQFCLEVLKSDSRSKFAKDITTLTKIAVDVAAKNSTATRDYFLSVKTGPPAVLTSLKDCIKSYNVVIVEFSNCFKEEDCSLIGYDIHDAGDEVRRCQAITDSNGAHDSFITTSNNVTLEFSGLGESLANLMCDKTGA